LKTGHKYPCGRDIETGDTVATLPADNIAKIGIDEYGQYVIQGPHVSWTLTEHKAKKIIFLKGEK
jgi:hypothetical protein